MEFDRDLRARQEVRLLAQQAQQAFEGLQKLDQSGLDRITEALSRAGALHAAELSFRETMAIVSQCWLTDYTDGAMRRISFRLTLPLELRPKTISTLEPMGTSPIPL